MYVFVCASVYMCLRETESVCVYVCVCVYMHVCVRAYV